MASVEQHDPPDMLTQGPPDLLFIGGLPPSRKARRRASAAALAVAVAVVALVAWQVWPRPLPDFSTVDLQGVYAGMVRGDGQNDVSTLTRDQVREAPVRVSPVSCTPLFDATRANQFPTAAVDGVSTYWLNEGTASISLLTYRYLDQAAARKQYAAIETALAECAGKALKLGRAGRLEAQRIPVTAIRGVTSYLSYLLSSPGESGRFATGVFQLNNTVTWQYRYDFAAGAYSPLPAHQLMESMVSQMRSVQQAHR